MKFQNLFVRLKLALWFVRKTIIQWWMVLAVVLLLLKLFSVLALSWWLVTLPAWLPILVLFSLPGSALVYIVIVSIIKSIITK